MTGQVLDLTPSATGWYYPQLWLPAPPVSGAQLSAPAPRSIPVMTEVATVGYGPDGRIRRVSARPRLWLLA